MPPAIFASDYTSRTTPDVFVPPNDFQTPRNELHRQKWYRDFLARGRRPPEKGGHERIWKRALSTFPESRQRKERHFPVARPDDPVMALLWPVTPESTVFDALNALAGCIGYVGHSASLARCRFLLVTGPAHRYPARSARRRVYPGRLRELERAHRTNPVRPVIRPGAPVFTSPDPIGRSQSDWLVLEVADSEPPDIRAAPLVCRVLRQALMSGYRKTGLEHAIPEIVSGHAPDGTPTRLPHLAIMPMAFAGFPHVDGRVLGFALIPPRGTTLDHIEGFRVAFENVAHYRPDEERRVLKLEGQPLNESLYLAPALDDGARKRSLSSDPYLMPARIWASTKPIVLERHLKRRDDAELRELVAHACENAGLPRPVPDRVQVGKHSAVDGMPPARPLAGEPSWLRSNTSNTGIQYTPVASIATVSTPHDFNHAAIARNSSVKLANERTGRSSAPRAPPRNASPCLRQCPRNGGAPPATSACVCFPSFDLPT